ncbi:MAG: hypothetical protein MZU97_05425 [Bacillus subtilis]|nr:hypothetical protein [Bacillus subtilis]
MKAVVKDAPAKGFNIVTKTITTDLTDHEVLVKVSCRIFLWDGLPHLRVRRLGEKPTETAVDRRS